MSDVTRLLDQLNRNSDENVVEQLLPIVYEELRRMAASKIAGEKPGQTIDATGLVHEAYLKLVDNRSFESRRHFFGAAAEAMRRILIDRSRAKNAGKRGGDFDRVDLEPNQIKTSCAEDDQRLASLNESLERFQRIEPEKTELVKMRYFVGLTIKETADVLGISTATADRHWAYAKAWLQNDMEN